MSREVVPFQYESTEGTQTESLSDILRRREMPYEDWAKLKAHADQAGVMFFSTPDSPESVDFLAEIGSPCLKIAGGDMDNYPLIDHAARTGLPVLLDTRGTLGELEAAVTTCKEAGNEDIVIVHTPSGYPSVIDSIRLRTVQVYLNTFPYPVGFSDHTPDMDMDVAALALGAHFIEKTITLDQTIQSAEHIMSIEPDAFADFVRRLREVEAAMGDPRVKVLTADEREAMKKTRRGVVLTRDAAAGEQVTAAMVNYKRPGYGISPKFVDLVVGKRLKHDKSMDVSLTWEDLVDGN